MDAIIETLRVLLLVSIIASDSSLVAPDDGQCYYPNGKPESNLVACNQTSGAVSSCCSIGDTCHTNGLCKNDEHPDNGLYWRDGCTDSSWGEGCPQMCTGRDIGMYRNPKMAAVY